MTGTLRGPVGGRAGPPDPALTEALAAQLPSHAWRDSWLARHAAPPAKPAAEPPGRGIRPGPALVQTEADGASAACMAMPEAPPKPVPPLLTREQRDVARLKAVQLAGERKMIRARLQAGQITLAQALARDDDAARRMRTETLLRALPGIGAATAGRLMTAAGIDRGRRVGGLSTGQRERLVAAYPEPVGRPERRHDSGRGSSITAPGNATLARP